MRCMMCGTENAEGNKFCMSCGTPLPNMAGAAQGGMVQSGTAQNGNPYNGVQNPAQYGNSGKASLRGLIPAGKKKLVIIGAAGAVLALILILVLFGGGRSGSATKEDAIKAYLEAMGSRSTSKYLDAKVPSEFQSAYVKKEEKSNSKSFDKIVDRRCDNWDTDLVFDEIKEVEDISDGSDFQKYFKKEFGDDSKLQAVFYVEYYYHKDGSTSRKKASCDLFLYDGRWYYA